MESWRDLEEVLVFTDTDRGDTFLGEVKAFRLGSTGITGESGRCRVYVDLSFFR